MKKVLCVLSAILMLTVLIAGGVFSVSAEVVGETDDAESNESGVVWEFDPNTGVLSISGEGKIESDAPWASYRDQILSVEIGEGITSVGVAAFSGYDKLIDVTFAEDSALQAIGGEAFYNCSSLVKITIPNGVTTIDGWAFNLCGSLNSLVIPDSVVAIGVSAFGNTALKTLVYCGTSEQWDEIGKATNWDANMGSYTLSCHNDQWIPAGEETHTSECSYCGHIATASHSWNGGEITKAPTHSAEGVKTYTCTGCGSTKTESVAKDPVHVYGGWIKHNEEQHKKVCGCGEGVVYADHTWNKGEITKTPTHLTEGEKVYVCTDCGERKITSIAKDPVHIYGDWISYDDKDQHKKECVCGVAVVYGGHTWDEGVIDKEPTHAEEGKKIYTCADCGGKKTESVAKDPTHIYGEWTKFDADWHKKVCDCGEGTIFEVHTWDEGKITLEPTHMKEGEKTYICTDCGEKKTESIARSPEHIYKDYFPCNKEADENENWHKQVCECGEGTIFAVHNWNEGEVSLAPTHMEPGKMTYTCLDCGAKKAEVTAKDPTHVYGEWVTHDGSWHKKECECGDETIFAAHAWDAGKVTVTVTHLEKGEMTYTCADCGKKKVESIARDTKHVYGTWVICDENQHKQVCGCGEVVYAVHQWDNGKVTKHYTDTETGEFTYTCVDCGQTRVEVLEVAHIYEKWVNHDENQHKMECGCGEGTIYADHVWDSGTVTTAATHMEEGVKIYSCADCGATKSETIAKVSEHTYGKWMSCDEVEDSHKKECECGKGTVYADHTWDAGKITKESTHLADGERVYTCADCDATKSEVISKNPMHVYTEWVSCGEEDPLRHKKECECGKGTVYADHTWDAGKITKTPTHMKNGEILYTCEDCSATKTAILDEEPAHVYGKWISCGDGSTLHKQECECGKKTVYAEHAWDKGVMTVKSTHMATGEMTYTCTECDQTRTEILVKDPTHVYGDWISCGDEDPLRHKQVCECEKDTIYAEHIWDEGVVTKDYTHMTKGEILYTCEDCGQEKTESVAAGHSYGDWIDHSDDQHKMECECGEDTIYADHTWDEGKITKASTHISEGVMTYVCSDCGAIKNESIAKGAHSYGEWISCDKNQHKKECKCGEETILENHAWDDGVTKVEPTADAEGEKLYTCSACGYTRTEVLPMTDTDSDDLSGCNSTVWAGAGLILVLLIGAVALIHRKKRRI